VFNRVRRTSLSKHADAEMQRAKLKRLTASLSDLVAYGELSYSGRVPTTGTAGAEVTALLAELRGLGWIPAARNDVARSNMKAFLKQRRPSPTEALAIATSTAPQQPPAQVVADPVTDGATTLNLRVRRSTVAAIEQAAKGRGLTMKQVVCQALEAAGVYVAPADLEDRTPRRK
jgi:hypothetical protein